MRGFQKGITLGSRSARKFPWGGGVVVLSIIVSLQSRLGVRSWELGVCLVFVWTFAWQLVAEHDISCHFIQEGLFHVCKNCSSFCMRSILPSIQEVLNIYKYIKYSCTQALKCLGCLSLEYLSSIDYPWVPIKAMLRLKKYSSFYSRSDLYFYSRSNLSFYSRSDLSFYSRSDLSFYSRSDLSFYTWYKKCFSFSLRRAVQNNCFMIVTWFHHDCFSIVTWSSKSWNLETWGP